MRRWLPSVVLIAAALVAFGAAGHAWVNPRLSIESTKESTNDPPTPDARTDCVGDLARSRACHQEHYRQLTLASGVDAAVAALHADSAASAEIRAGCHFFAHAIGEASAELTGSVAGAFATGEPLCFAGYFHGAVEAVVVAVGAEQVRADPDVICADLGDRPRYSLYHRNCAHGLGHSFMLASENDLLIALEGCDGLTDPWERESCYGGAFNQNIMARDDPDHPATYLRADEPFYPCTALDGRYQRLCYQKQAAYPLVLRDSEFAPVFALCATVDAPYRPACYQGLGANAASFTILRAADAADQAALTGPLCLLGQDDEARTNCAVGAVRAMRNTFFRDTEAKLFCDSLPLDLRPTCLKAANDPVTWPD